MPRVLGLVPPTLALTFLFLALAVTAAQPVAAHSCTAPVEVPVGQEAPVAIGITAEASAVTAVDVEIPEGFQVTSAEGAGWSTEVSPTAVHFDGGPVEPHSCGSVTIHGIAEQQGRLELPLVLHTADGDELRHDRTEVNHPRGAQLVFAGSEAPAPGGAGDDPDLLVLTGIGLGALGVVGLVVLALDRTGVIALRRR